MRKITQILSCLLFMFLSLSLIPSTYAFDYFAEYGDAGYCSVYDKPVSAGGLNYDRTQVPNYPFSEYLKVCQADPDINTCSNKLMHRIKADQLCLQQADIQFLITKTTDQGRRDQLQEELNSIIQQKNKLNDIIRMQREREERLKKILETMNVLSKRDDEGNIKGFIDFESIAIEVANEEWGEMKKDILKTREERVKET